MRGGGQAPDAKAPERRPELFGSSSMQMCRLEYCESIKAAGTLPPRPAIRLTSPPDSLIPPKEGNANALEWIFMQHVPLGIHSGCRPLRREGEGWKVGLVMGGVC